MPTPHRIRLRRERDVAETINVTFAFIRQNFVPLARCLLLTAVPVYAVAALVSLFVQVQTVGALEAASAPGEVMAAWGTGGGLMLFGLAMNVVGVVLFLVVTFAYMRLYESEGHGDLPVGRVWKEASPYFVRMLGTLLFLIVAVGASFVILLVPCLGFLAVLVGGTYLLVGLAPLLPMRVWEDRDLFSALQRSRQLVKGHWWPTFGFVLVAYVTQMLMSFLLVLPGMVLGVVAGLHQVPDLSIDLSYAGAAVVAAIGFVGQIGAALIYAVPILAMGFYYMSLVERHEHVGLRERVAERQRAVTGDDDRAEGPAWAL